jgi:siroheme synthase
MGLNKLVKLAGRLVDQGIVPETRVHILSKVSQPDALSFEGTLSTIAGVIETQKPPMPALVIIGQNAEKLTG